MKNINLVDPVILSIRLDRIYMMNWIMKRN